MYTMCEKHTHTLYPHSDYLGNSYRFKVKRLVDLPPQYFFLLVSEPNTKPNTMESQNCLMILIFIILGGYVIILGGYVVIFGD